MLIDRYQGPSKLARYEGTNLSNQEPGTFSARGLRHVRGASPHRFCLIKMQEMIDSRHQKQSVEVYCDID